MNKASLMRARLAAAQRERRLILDDDGDLVFSEDAKRGSTAFLQQRFNPVLGRPVDSVNWCIMWGIAVGKGETSYWRTQQQGEPLNDSMSDPTPVMIEASQKNDLEIFGSVRMNDTHDAFGKPHGRLDYPMKVDHPEWLIGDCTMETDISISEAGLYWSGLNYAVQQVREDRLWWIRNTAQQYDLDGVDLNFFRMPYYFKPGAEEDGISTMTEFLRDVRREIDEASLKRGRPLLLGARTPGTLQTCLVLGLDVETWIKEGLLDRLSIGGGYMPMTNPAEELVSLGHSHGVPVYPCINCGAPVQGTDLELRGAASNIFWAGADGIYLWNYQYRDVQMLGYGRPTDDAYSLLDQIGSEHALKYTNKSFCLEQRVGVASYARACHAAQIPIVISKNSIGKVLTIRIGDDVREADRVGKLGSATLKLGFESIEDEANVTAVLNGEVVGQAKADNDSVLIPTRASLVQQGDNDLRVEITGEGQQDVLLNAVSLDVEYT